MTAPTMILLGHGSPNSRVAEISHDICAGVLRIRPELDVHVAFMDRGAPSGLQLVNKLVKRGVSEVVFVPLLLSDAFSGPAGVPALVAQVQAGHPDLAVIASRPIGPEAQLLAVVDRRLRLELHERRIGELDGLVFAAAGSTDPRSLALVARRARQWGSHHRLPCVTAFGHGPGPTTGEAVRTLRSQGRRHLAVGSWFLAPGELYLRQAELALDAGALAVSAPLGAEPEIAETALARYLVAAMDLVDLSLDLAGAEAVPTRHLSVVSA
ncbi:MAG TPA: CbiX/SirB N-terminal domain-containing protein [Propionibacteriaceae bacterium]|nr:CbiX/SirB N-terminal domain-containing protein [Propionibacteriaceae bacterium]